MRLAFISVATVAMTWSASALADPPQLKGSYGFTGEAACLFAPGHSDAQGPNGSNPTPGQLLPLAGFNPNLQVTDGGPTSSAFSNSFSVQGIRTFNGDGTGTVKGTSVSITIRPTPGPTGYPHFPASASVENFSYTFTYTVDNDGGWTATTDQNSFSGTFIAGPRTGQTVTIDRIPQFSGLISNDGKTLIGSHTDAVKETLTFSNGDVFPRICHRSRVFIKLNNND